MQLTLQFCPFKAMLSLPLIFAASSPVWWLPARSGLPCPLPLAGVLLDEEAGLFSAGKCNSVPTLTRRFSVLIGLASTSSTSLPLGTRFSFTAGVMARIWGTHSKCERLFTQRSAQKCIVFHPQTLSTRETVKFLLGPHTVLKHEKNGSILGVSLPFLILLCCYFIWNLQKILGLG